MINYKASKATESQYSVRHPKRKAHIQMMSLIGCNKNQDKVLRAPALPSLAFKMILTSQISIILYHRTLDSTTLSKHLIVRVEPNFIPSHGMLQSHFAWPQNFPINWCPETLMNQIAQHHLKIVIHQPRKRSLLSDITISLVKMDRRAYILVWLIPQHHPRKEWDIDQVSFD